jgi:hypothetical protein
VRSLRRTVLLASLLLTAIPATGQAQVFLASQPHPDFAIGPLFVVAQVRPDLGPISLTLSWSLTTPPGQRAADIKQDLFLLWPNELVDATAEGPADPILAREVQTRGFSLVASGRLTLGYRDRLQMGIGAPATPLPEVASFVTFTRSAAVSGASLGSGTYIKIPWTPKLGDPLAVTVLTFTTRGLVTPKPATWFEEAFWGRRWVLTTGFGDIGSPASPIFPLYFEHRDRMVRLGREFAVAVATFADADHLRIEAIGPTTATRRPSRLRTGAEVVTLALAPTEGVTPQLLNVQFSYHSGMIAWRPILVSAVLLALGNLAGFILLSKDVSQFLRSRLALRRAEPEFARGAGQALPRALADRITPGSTSEAEVITLCGRPDEEHHRRGSTARRTLVYRAVRRLPSARLALGPLATVHHWDDEYHELEIELEGDRVSAVQSRVRRQRVAG